MSPIPEVMDGVERAVGIAKRGEQTENIALLFDIAERALSHAAQEITSSGTARPDSPEAREFARRFGAILDTSGEVVPIQSLYFDDDGPHILEAGTPVAAPGRLAQMELVAHGEHLRQAADELERAQWDTQRELRALALTSTFRSLISAGGGPVETAISEFARVAQVAVSKGTPLQHTEEFATQLREVGEILIASAEGEPGELAARLAGATARLDELPVKPQPPAAKAEPDHPTRPKAPSAEVEAQEEEEEETEFVAIPVDDSPGGQPKPEVVGVTVESGVSVEAVTTGAEDAWAGDEAAVVAEAAEPEPVPEPVATSTAEDDTSGPGLAASWARYEQLDLATINGEEDLGDLLGPTEITDQPATMAKAATPIAVTASTEEVVPITQLGYPEPTEEAAEYEASEPIQPAPVPITELFYSGPAAMERARFLRNEIHAAWPHRSSRDHT
jgi:hypothetical protein